MSPDTWVKTDDITNARLKAEIKESVKLWRKFMKKNKRSTALDKYDGARCLFRCQKLFADKWAKGKENFACSKCIQHKRACLAIREGVGNHVVLPIESKEEPVGTFGWAVTV